MVQAVAQLGTHQQVPQHSGVHSRHQLVTTAANLSAAGSNARYECRGVNTPKVSPPQGQTGVQAIEPVNILRFERGCVRRTSRSGEAAAAGPRTQPHSEAGPPNVYIEPGRVQWVSASAIDACKPDWRLGHLRHSGADPADSSLTSPVPLQMHTVGSIPTYGLHLKKHRRGKGGHAAKQVLSGMLDPTRIHAAPAELTRVPGTPSLLLTCRS